MRRYFVGVALLTLVGAAGAQTFVPRIDHGGGSDDGSWSKGQSDEIAENARRFAESKTFELPKGSLEPSREAFAANSAAMEVAQEPFSVPLIPIMGVVAAVAAVGIGVGTKARLARSRG